MYIYYLHVYTIYYLCVYTVDLYLIWYTLSESESENGKKNGENQKIAKQ